MKGPARAPDLADRAAEQHPPLTHILPVDQPAHHLGPIEAPGFDIRLRQRIVAQRTHRLGIVDREPRGLLQRLGAEASIGAIALPVERQIAVVIGEPERDTIGPRDRPATRHGAKPAGQMRM